MPSLTNTIYVSLDVSFRESESYYSGGASESSFQGERGSEGNPPLPTTEFEVPEFEEIEELEARFNTGRPIAEPCRLVAETSVPEIVDSGPGRLVAEPSRPVAESAEDSIEEIAAVPPFSTPSTEESAQNVLPLYICLCLEKNKSS